MKYLISLTFKCEYFLWFRKHLILICHFFLHQPMELSFLFFYSGGSEYHLCLFENLQIPKVCRKADK